MMMVVMTMVKKTKIMIPKANGRIIAMPVEMTAMMTVVDAHYGGVRAENRRHQVRTLLHLQRHPRVVPALGCLRKHRCETANGKMALHLPVGVWHPDRASHPKRMKS